MQEVILRRNAIGVHPVAAGAAVRVIGRVQCWDVPAWVRWAVSRVIAWEAAQDDKYYASCNRSISEWFWRWAVSGM